MFVFSDEYDQMICEREGIVFVCEEVQSDYEEKMQKLAKAYYEKLDSIVEFMIDNRLQDFYEGFYDNLTLSFVKPKLGKPIIDLGIDCITYVEHTLDDEHIFTVEFEDYFEKLNYCTVDG